MTTSAIGRDDQPLLGITLKIGSVIAFTLMGALVKYASDTVPPGEAVFFRSFFAIPVIFGWLFLRGSVRQGLHTKDPLGHIWRGLVGATAMGLGFTALGLIPFSEVTAIAYATPLMVTILAAMFLGEQIRIYRMSAVVAGLVGVLVVLSPRLTVLSDGNVSQTESLGAVIMFMAAVFMALAMVFVRKMVETERTSAITFYFALTTTVLSLFTIPFGWVMPDLLAATALIGAGLLGGVAQIMLTECYRHADTGVIAPFEYTSMLLALAIGYTVFGETPTRIMLIGAVIVVASGLFIIWREQKLGLERRRARRAMTPQG